MKRINVNTLNTHILKGVLLYSRCVRIVGPPLPNRFGPDGWTIGISPEAMLDKMGILDDFAGATLEAAILLQRKWIDVLSERSGSGVTYTQKGYTWTASAPGESPVLVTGEGIASIHIQPTVLNNLPAWSVVVDDPGLVALEFGVMPGAHPRGVVILPRPHARKAYFRARRKMKDVVVRRLKETHRF